MGLKLGGKRIEVYDAISPTEVRDLVGVNPHRVSGDNMSLTWLFTNIEKYMCMDTDTRMFMLLLIGNLLCPNLGSTVWMYEYFGVGPKLMENIAKDFPRFLHWVAKNRQSTPPKHLLRAWRLDLIDNKLIQFDNAVVPNIITNPLPPHQEGNVNAIITMEKRTPDFSLPSFLWKAMLQALVQESHLDLKGMGTPGFDWGIYLSSDDEDSHTLFDCKVLQAQVQSLVEYGIIRIEGKLCEKVATMPSSSVVIEEKKEMLTNPGSLDSWKGLA
ncbi:hypothetical protein SO802_017582 [Lithocarpus litseifolius]|uniref:Uncharacterized protein n=1 Tax=Lithocarpus litseifolius TaxID=425828 RepID=A0AAW2CL98_9ROSI